jgi:hypothetical protein
MISAQAAIEANSSKSAMVKRLRFNQAEFRVGAKCDRSEIHTTVETTLVKDFDR